MGTVATLIGLVFYAAFRAAASDPLIIVFIGGGLFLIWAGVKWNRNG